MITTEPGFTSEICSIYIAKDLNFVGLNPEKTEEIKTLAIKIKDLRKMIMSGKIFTQLNNCILN